jgi:iron complex transport system ATP-binding protein
MKTASPSPGSAPLLEASQLRIGYAGRGKASWQLSTAFTLRADAPGLTAILGPNGAGKSTLIRTLAGFQDPLSGRVCYRGQNIADLSLKELSRLRSVAFTHVERPPWMSGWDWVLQGRIPYTPWNAHVSENDRVAVANALESVNATHLKDRHVNECSDGELQRLVIAQTLAQDCPILLMDEPLAHLDMPHKVEIIARLRRIAQSRNQLIILSVHDIALAFRFADSIWGISPGGEVTCGSPAEIRSAGFVERAFNNEFVRFNPLSMDFEPSTDPIA